MTAFGELSAYRADVPNVMSGNDRSGWRQSLGREARMTATGCEFNRSMQHNGLLPVSLTPT